MSHYIVTIDGPAGAGKSSIARALAQRLKLPYLDTGAMFRFLAWKLGPDGNKKSAKELEELARTWRFSLSGWGNDTQLLINGQPLGDEIRTDEVSELASALATSQEIRTMLRAVQQSLAATNSLVVEGRDMGTVVFPNAKYKFFLDASPEIRARRRWQQLQEKHIHKDLEEISANMAKRDEQDQKRALAPLKPAKDAIIIDTSHLDITDVLEEMLKQMDQ